MGYQKLSEGVKISTYQISLYEDVLLQVSPRAWHHTNGDLKGKLDNSYIQYIYSILHTCLKLICCVFLAFVYAVGP